VPNSESKYIIQLIDLDEEISINLNKDFNDIASEDYYRSSMVILGQEGAVFSQGYTIEISGTIPVNAGVSSSSALVVAWLRFLIEAQEAQWNVSDAQIGEWAYRSEVQFFKQPGGLMDQYTIAQGGMIYIDTQKGEVTPLSTNLGTLILAESGLAKKTLSVLQNARDFAQRAIEEVKIQYSEFDLHKAQEVDYNNYESFVSNPYKPYWYASIHNHLITQKAKKQLLQLEPDLIQLGSLMNAHQKILQECIQNTPEPIINQMNAALQAGALGAKIIGSGGGGAMVAIAEEHTKENIIQAFKTAGAHDAYEVKLAIH
jgi:galactokinase